MYCVTVQDILTSMELKELYFREYIFSMTDLQQLIYKECYVATLYLHQHFKVRDLTPQ